MEGARDRARALRRNVTEAEKSIWQILRSCQIDRHRFRIDRSHLGVILLILFVMTRA